MPLAPVEALVILATELAHNMHWLLVSNLLPAFDERRHHIHLVVDQALPVFTVHLASLAVEMRRITDLVSYHALLVWEAVLTFDRKGCVRARHASLTARDFLVVRHIDSSCGCRAWLNER